MPAAASVKEYLAQLDPPTRSTAERVLRTVKQNLPTGYRESMSWGMPSFEIPLSKYPNTYNGKPLLYVALAARKSGYSLYLLGPYLDPALARWLADAFARAGKRLDMGKSCLRFKKLDDLPLDAIGELVGKMSVAAYLKRYELGLGMRTAKRVGQPAQKKVSKKRTPARKTR